MLGSQVKSGFLSRSIGMYCREAAWLEADGLYAFEDLVARLG